MTAIVSTALSILEFILAFGVLVFLHEFGHFIFARLSHIEVEEFGFGYPPKIVRLFRWRGTDFTLNWIPVGGFCRMKGETGTASEPGSFQAASPWRRLLTLLGGPMMNLFLGMIIITFLIMRVGAADPTRVQITGVAKNSPAAVANMQVGDIFVDINGQKVEGLDSLSALVKANQGKLTEITLLRGTQTIPVELTPRVTPPEGEGAMGTVISNPTVKVSFFQAVPSAFISTMDQGLQLLMLPVKLISGQIAPTSARMVSVKGLYDIFSQVQTIDAKEAIADPAAANLNTISYLAILSIALGFTNLLPIPAMDGGHILFVLPELLFHKKVSPEFENKVHLIGFSVLMILMVGMVINDIINPIVIP